MNRFRAIRRGCAKSGFRRRGCWRESTPSIGKAPCPTGKSPACPRRARPLEDVLRHAQDLDWLAAGTELDACLPRLPGCAAGRRHPWRFPARQYSLRKRSSRRIDRLGAGLDRRAGPRPRLDTDDVRRPGVAPSWQPVAPVSRDRSDRRLSRGRRPGLLQCRMVSGAGALSVSVRSPASMSNFIAPASVRTVCGSDSRLRSRPCLHAASSWRAAPQAEKAGGGKVIDFELPADLVELRDRVEAFIADKIVPYENDPRQTAHGAPEYLRRELVELARQAQLLSPHAPKEYGGLGWIIAAWPSCSRPPAGRPWVRWR